MAILLSYELDFKTKSITRHKERHFIMIKEEIHLKEIKILNAYMLNDRTFWSKKNDRIIE